MVLTRIESTRKKVILST